MCGCDPHSQKCFSSGLVSENLVAENRKEVCNGQNYRYRRHHSKSNSWLEIRLCSFAVTQDMRTIALPFQARTAQNMGKDLHDIRIKKRTVREWRGNRKKCYEANILGGNSLPWCQLLFFLVNLILRFSEFIQNQMSSEAFFSYEICTHGLTPWIWQ